MLCLFHTPTRFHSLASYLPDSKQKQSAAAPPPAAEPTRPSTVYTAAPDVTANGSLDADTIAANRAKMMQKMMGGSKKTATAKKS